MSSGKVINWLDSFVTIWQEEKKKLCSSLDIAKWLRMTDPTGRSNGPDVLLKSEKIEEHAVNGHFSSPDCIIAFFTWGNLSNNVEVASENLLQEPAVMVQRRANHCSDRYVCAMWLSPHCHAPCRCRAVCPCAVKAGERGTTHDVCAKSWPSSAETYSAAQPGRVVGNRLTLIALTMGW